MDNRAGNSWWEGHIYNLLTMTLSLELLKGTNTIRFHDCHQNYQQKVVQIANWSLDSHTIIFTIAV